MKKGFTLIELLAVIVILAIIALIATPIILGVVENARKSAAGSSALGYIDAVEKEIALGGLDKYAYPTGRIDVISTEPYNTIEVNGEKPSKGILNIRDDYVIERSVLCINNYKVEVIGHKVNKIAKGECANMNMPTFKGIEDKEILQWREFDPLEGVTATDGDGKDITGRIEVENKVTPAIVGTYTLIYKVTDEVGNEATAERHITVIAAEYIDNSKAAKPNLKENLVAVIIDEDGTVHQADINDRWYDYDEKKWANAVVLNDGASVNEDGTITKTDISAYFVWIPKYRYKIWDLGNYTNSQTTSAPSAIREIKIEFNTEDTVDSETTCKTPMVSGETGQCAVDKWMTHPAFISFGVDGFWVGKFKPSGTYDNFKIVPANYFIYNNVRVSFNAAYNYDKSAERILDSHMMKNTEWGAVAYLSHSKYGIMDGVLWVGKGQGNNITSSDMLKTTTTGNITGVYDMNGDGDEYMAAYIRNNYGHSTFDETSISQYASKYFDVYEDGGKYSNYSKRILGDATAEMGPFLGSDRIQSTWYNDYAYFPSASWYNVWDNPAVWFARSSDFGSSIITGIFSFFGRPGSTNSSFRVVLSPK